MPSLSTDNDFLSQLETHVISTLLTPTFISGQTISKELAKRLVASISDFSKRYISRSAILKSIDEASAVAYSTYFGVINAVKVQKLLSLLPPEFTPSSILDFGAGCGTASMAAIWHYQKSSAISLVEISPGMTTVAKKLLNHKTGELYTHKNLSEVPKAKTFDLVVAANSINELPQSDQPTTVSALWQRTNPGGYLILLEPGTQELSANLVALREFMVQSHGGEPAFSIAYPCTHHNPCLLLKNDSGWCHRELQIARTPLLRQLDAALGFNKHTVSFSALILHKESTKNIPNSSAEYRVITAPQKNKIGTTGYLCGADHQGLVTLTKRSRTDENRQFEKLDMHDKTPLLPGLDLIFQSK